METWHGVIHKVGDDLDEPCSHLSGTYALVQPERDDLSADEVWSSAVCKRMDDGGVLLNIVS